MTSLEQLSAVELVAGYHARAFSPTETVDALAGRIEALNPLLGAFTTLSLDRARSEAVASTGRYAHGVPLGRLDGVPLAVKDLYDTAGLRTTYGSAMFVDHVPSRDAEAVRRARAEGAIVIGKTQTHEFAWGITSVNRQMGTARNPWDTSRISGGSSGGSAVALAAALVPLALGTDTGGSIRIPSAFCGTTGLKPTYGRVSTAGIFPLAHTLDHAGPMARTPGDVALLLGSIAASDAADTTGVRDAPGLFGAAPYGGLADRRVGLCPDLHPVRLDPVVEAVFDAAVRRVDELGAVLVEVALPEAAQALASYTVIQRAEALFTHTRAGLYPARAAEYGDDVGRWLALATGVELADYLEASLERERLRAGFRRVFDEIDLLLTPVSAAQPFGIDEELRDHFGAQLALRELVLGYTVPHDLAGIPACSIRAGFDEDGCPVGIQFAAAPGADHAVLGAAQAFYAATAEIQGRRPALGA